MAALDEREAFYRKVSAETDKPVCEYEPYLSLLEKNNPTFNREQYLDLIKILLDPTDPIGHFYDVQFEDVGDVGMGNHAGTEPKPLNQNSNDLDSSGLLNNPSRKDGWFDVIDDMTRDFHAELGKIPNETQAWAALWTSPPKGYGIITGKDQVEDCLIMPGIKNLGKSAFTKRWGNYTANKP